MKTTKDSPMKNAIKLVLSIVCLLGCRGVSFSQVNWDAYNDFYFDSSNYQNNSPSVPIPWPNAPTAAGMAWGYYDCNVNGAGGYPASIGSYFGPGNDVALGQVLLAMANYQPLGVGVGQFGGGVPGSTDAWDATGGSGFARYGDSGGWGTALGEYGGAWYPGAPGYGTSHASDTGLFFLPGYLGNSTSDGIGNLVSWTAPSDGTYAFTCSFLIASNAPGNAYAVVDSKGGIEVPRTLGAMGTYNAYSFTNTFSAGDVVEFQVGCNGQPANEVGFNANIVLIPEPSSIALLAAGLGVLVMIRRYKIAN